MKSLDEIRLPVAVCPPMSIKDVDIIEEEGDWFIRGPIPGSWIGKASSLPGDYTLNVALAIWYAKGFSGKSNKVILERFHFNRLNVGVDSTRRALQHLQDAGLIKYTRNGHRLQVTILAAKSDT